MSSADDNLNLWGRLLSEQTELFQQTTEENMALRAKQVAYETDVRVWRGAVSSSQDRIQELEKKVFELTREVNFVKDNPLILCLIDGDGNIFIQDLLKLGRAGGRQAALLLTKGINDHLDLTQDPFAKRAQVWLTVYLNKSGLAETVANKGFCTLDEFDDFVIGFNQASPLFSVVDVGNGKEAADAKIKEGLRLFTRFPQVHKVFFGGGHDNGYTTILTQLETEGLMPKIILLRGYADIARELQILNLPVAEIEGVFLKQKIVSHPFAFKKGAATHSTPNIKTVGDTERFRSPSKSGQAATGSPTKPSTPLAQLINFGQTGGKHLDPSIPMSKHKPPPCNFYYLAKCSSGMNCRYGHDYELSQDQLQELSVNSRKTPCPAVNRDKPCSAGERCIHGHFCPKGPKCHFFSKGKCKFTGKDMHSAAAKLKGAAAKGKKGPTSASSSPAAGPSSSNIEPSPSPEESESDYETYAYPESQQSHEPRPWDGTIVNDMSPPMSPNNPALTQLQGSSMFTLNQPWMYPTFGLGYNQQQQ